MSTRRHFVPIYYAQENSSFIFLVNFAYEAKDNRNLTKIWQPEPKNRENIRFRHMQFLKNFAYDICLCFETLDLVSMTTTNS